MSQRHPSRRISAPWRAAWLVAALATPAAHGQQVTTREDLARDKPATASSYQDDAKAAGAAFDGEPESRWCASDGSAPQWLQVDLGRPEALTGCRIVWESDGAAYRYKVEGSVDGKAWSNLVDATNSTDAHQSQAHPLRDATARHVKLTVTGLPEGQWASLFEFQVFGTRPAPAVAKKPAGDVAADSILKEIKLPPGFEATVFAAPPDVKYPTCLVATPQGEVFVGIDENGSLDAKPERGRVVRCVDKDGDGKADAFNVFATMDSPRGLVWDDGTLYVLHPPQLSAYRDTDGDGKADQSEVLVDGIGFTLQYRGADHTTNGIRLGIDGYLYIAVGDYGFVKAQGKDGGPLQMLGGGVARVRTDGTGLEIVSRGQRNIYDVAISPKMDLFTRDNTNDGDGWDVRLSHVVPSGHYGYPSLFKRFGDEILQPLADYGGGSPCGSLYLDEPGYPAPYNDTLYTCEWGRGGVFRHPLKPKGATFEAGQEPFITMPRPTDIDVDGSGRMFISSWRDGGYTYSKPTVGYVIRVVPQGLKAKPFPDFRKMGTPGLVEAIASDSSVLRLAAQRELLRRRLGTDAGRRLEALAEDASAGIDGRIAALFTLAQGYGPKVDDFLIGLAKPGELREFAITALTARRESASGAPALDATLPAIADPDPRVRLAAVVATGRLSPGVPKSSPSGQPVATALIGATTDADPIVAHAAVKALVRAKLGAESGAALAAVTADDQARGLVQALGEMHDPKSVAPLADLAGSSTAKPEARRAALKALCRMYYAEAPYEAGKWWGTRPDTGGPYYKPVTWEGSEAIGKALRSALKQAEPETRKFLLNEMLRDRLDFEEATPLAVQLAETDPAMRSAVVGLFAARPQLSADAIRFLAAPTPDASTRVAAIRGLLKHQNQPEARAAALDVLAAVGTAPEPNPDLAGLWAEYAREGRHARDLARFVKLAEGADAGQATLGYAILLGVASNAKAPEPAKAEAEAALDRAGRDPARLPRLLRAAGLLKANGYADKVRAALADGRTEVKEAAEFAARRLNIATTAATSTKPGPKVRPIAATPYDAVLAAALKDPGDAALGAQLFERQGCVNCHAVSKAGPLKGPYLGDVAARYARAELVESILKPSARIAQGFETQKLGLADGRTLEGFVVREAGDELELRNSTGNVVVVPKADIEERGKSELSVMPQGLMDPLTPHDLASLLAYFESIKGK